MLLTWEGDVTVTSAALGGGFLNHTRNPPLPLLQAPPHSFFAPLFIPEPS